VVEAEEKIQLVRKRKAVAKIVPMNGAGKKVNWSDTWSRADAIIGEKPTPAKPGSQIVRGATMRVYFDPSFLVALYLPEALSAQARAVVDRQAQTSCSRDLASM